MASKTRKTRKPVEIDPIETLERWIAGQADTQEARDDAQANWEAGANNYMDIVEVFGEITQTTHCERHYLTDENEEFTEKYIVVCWDDNGNVTFGGM